MGSSDRPGGRRRWLRWLGVAAWIGLILWLGSAGLSADSTSRFLGPLIAWLLPNAGPETRELAHFVVRKGAHLFEYGVLAVLAWRAARPDLPRTPSAALTLGLVLAVAVVDEARQAGLAARTGSPGDVALDVAGACLALGLLFALRALRRRASPVRG